MISTSYRKEINPPSYNTNVDANNYDNQFQDSVLSETITKIVTDAEGNTVSVIATVTRGKNQSETVTTYKSDEFGRTTEEVVNIVIKETAKFTKYKVR